MKAMNVAVIMYHGFSPKAIKKPSLSVVAAELKHQLFFLKDCGYTSVTSPEQFDQVDKPVMITFDDALFSVFDIALPIMNDLGFQGVVFLPAAVISDTLPYNCGIDYAESDRFMTVDELQTLLMNGWTIESHAYSHQKLTELTFDQVREEFTLSRNLILEKLNFDSKMIAYPYGSYNRFILEIAEKAGFNYGFSVHQGLVKSLSSEMRLPRLEIDNETDLNTFKYMLNTGFKTKKDAFIGKIKNYLFKSPYIKDVLQSVLPNKIN